MSNTPYSELMYDALVFKHSVVRIKSIEAAVIDDTDPENIKLNIILHSGNTVHQSCSDLDEADMYLDNIRNALLLKIRSKSRE